MGASWFVACIALPYLDSLLLPQQLKFLLQLLPLPCVVPFLLEQLLFQSLHLLTQSLSRKSLFLDSYISLLHLQLCCLLQRRDLPLKNSDLFVKRCDLVCGLC